VLITQDAFEGTRGNVNRRLVLPLAVLLLASAVTLLPADAQVTVSAPTAPPNPTAAIAFGTPIRVVSGAAVLAINQSTNVKSFTVKATWKQGNSIVGSGTAAVSDLGPGQRRAVVLAPSSAMSAAYDSIQIDLDRVTADTPSTPGADAAARIAFGPPAESRGGFDLEVTNNDGSPHSLTLGAALLRGGDLVGTASGTVGTLAPGQTTMTTLISIGQPVAYDELSPSVDAIS